MRFDELLKEVERGECFYIVRQGKRVAELSPINRKPHRRQGGTLKCKIWMAPDFDKPLADFDDYAS
jgi:antitoxin (DNA-binding transcriptional repressor) of toxin-antitoxin stability system